MRSTVVVVATLCAVAVVVARPLPSAAAGADDPIALERAALDRWGKGDPGGFLETYAPEITYFDVGVEKRMDGHAAMEQYLAPLTGKIKVKSYEMIGPKVQRHGDVSVLTYNLLSNAVTPDGKDVTVRWNSTSVYAPVRGRLKTIHSHWSLTALPCAKNIN